MISVFFVSIPAFPKGRKYNPVLTGVFLIN
jgi:hypothetical protein